MKLPLPVLGMLLCACGLAASSCQLTTAPVANRTALPADDGASVSARRQADVVTAACDISGAVQDFRNALGTLNANTPGSVTGGRREINWDGVPAQFTNTNDFAGDFFNQPVAGRARGVVFTTPGTGFRVSDVDFNDVDSDFGSQFGFFSPVRTFAVIGDNVMTVSFFVPGANTAATSTGFGVVFSDVDKRHSAFIQAFDADGRSLGRYVAPPCPGGLSFVGVSFATPIIARVEITSGRAAIAAGATDVSDHRRGIARDLVVMDDFIYGEPVAVGGLTTPTADLR
jgi:hypothetical protein